MVFEWTHMDQANPYNWPVPRKWLFTSVTASATLSVSFASSGYTGALSRIIEHFDVSRNVAMLGLTLYVVGQDLWPGRRSAKYTVDDPSFWHHTFPLPSFASSPGAVCLAISLALFAATSDPSIHWIAPTLAGIPFGIGLVLILVSVLSYLIDIYGVAYCASVLAGNAVLRSAFASAFPMFTIKMYEALGYRWATGVLAFFVLACLPLPFIFLKYGAAIRRKSKFASRG